MRRPAKKCPFLFRILCGLVIGCFFCGCASLPSKEWSRSAADFEFESIKVIQGVPFRAQKEYLGAQASLAMVLAWSGKAKQHASTQRWQIPDSIEEGLQQHLIAAAQREGRLAYPIAGVSDLLAEVSAGHPVIVLRNLGTPGDPFWLFAVVIGFDLDENRVLLHSGNIPFEKVSVSAFHRAWSGSDYWGLVILPPPGMPATVSQPEILSAVAGLQRARQWPAAIVYYDAILKRWPDSLAAHIGLGNCFYAMEDYESAEGILRVAVYKFPSEAVVFNNLAHVLYRQGKNEEARAAASVAAELGGSFVEEFHQTFEETPF